MFIDREKSIKGMEEFLQGLTGLSPGTVKFVDSLAHNNRPLTDKQVGALIKIYTQYGGVL
jgi:hypothetical protein